MYNAIKISKRIFQLLSVIFILTLLSGCFIMPEDHYSGDYPELFTVAISSLLGARGYSTSEIFHEALILVIDEDSYGRIMFYYTEDSEISSFNLLISQSSSETHVYFYPHFNFISLPLDEIYFERNVYGIFNVIFPEEMVEKLKQRNDWERPLNLEQAISVEIVRAKPTGPIPRAILREAHRESLGEHARGTVHYRYFNSDNYGRSIYVFSKRVNARSESVSGNHHAVVLFQPDGTFDENLGVMELTDWFHYQEELKEFMEKNDWNQPLSTLE